MAARSIWSATLAGAVIGISAASVVLLVPVIGIRKDIDHLILHWQELALYGSCIAVSAVAGARYRYCAAKQYQDFLEDGLEVESDPAPDAIPHIILDTVHRPPVELRDEHSPAIIDEQLVASTMEPENEGERFTSSLESSGSALPVSLTRSGDESFTPVSLPLNFRGDTQTEESKRDEEQSCDDLNARADVSISERPSDLPPIALSAESDMDNSDVLTEPQIEESLAGGPKKRRLGLQSADSKGRTLSLVILLYLILFVKCAVLCQRLQLGVIIMDPVSEELLRTFGLGVTVIGLYLTIRGLFVVKISPQTLQASPDMVPVPSPHVPRTLLSFLRNHPICTGWLVILSGLPLVYQAWFPLLAVPGIFVAMNWMFPSRKHA
ncbi:MAG: hypothetical protein K2X93_01975 [Candidatus Obscuribacterales bacterium]|nr:hypothetical protein [Candidatus Obscuribacterales bacterium]